MMIDPSNRFHVRRFLCLVAFAAITLTGCVDKSIARLHVDNASDQPYEVRVDGQLAGIAIPGDKTEMKVPVGQHLVEVTKAGDSIYQSMRTIETGTSLWSQNYFLNPDNTVRYAHVTIIYGDDSMTRKGQQTVTQIAAWAGGKEISEADQRLIEHKDLRDDAVPLGSDPWFEVPQGARILRALPETVQTKSRSEKRSTLIRIPTEIHDFLLKSAAMTEVSQDDIDDLYDAVAIVEMMIPSN